MPTPEVYKMQITSNTSNCMKFPPVFDKADVGGGRTKQRVKHSKLLLKHKY